MCLYKVIIPEQDDILIRADDFSHQPDNGRVLFQRESRNVAIFQLDNIVGIVQVEENVD